MREKSIIFDLGGVFIGIDYQRTKREFRNLGSLNFKDYFAQSNQKGLFNQFETGKISKNDFRHEIRKEFFIETSTDDQIDAAWNAMILSPIVIRIQTLIELKKMSRVFLFSNINEIHEKRVQEIFDESIGYKKFLSLFERVYFSHQIGFRKPNKESFERIINENNLPASKTLFIDDMLDNILGAQKAGLLACKLEQNDDLAALINNFYQAVP